VSGLYIEGANFDAGVLTAVKADSPALSEIPSFYFAWMQKVNLIAHKNLKLILIL